MISYRRELTRGGTLDADNKRIADYELAVLPVTIQRVNEAGVVSGRLVTVDALIDTGASNTAIHPDLRKELGLTPTDRRELGQGGLPGEEEGKYVPLYRARITIDDTGVAWDPYVVVRPLPWYPVAIGTDILMRYRFTYDAPGVYEGRAGWFFLDLPEPGDQ